MFQESLGTTNRHLLQKLRTHTETFMSNGGGSGSTIKELKPWMMDSREVMVEGSINHIVRLFDGMGC